MEGAAGEFVGGSGNPCRSGLGIVQREVVGSAGTQPSHTWASLGLLICIFLPLEGGKSVLVLVLAWSDHQLWLMESSAYAVAAARVAW